MTAKKPRMPGIPCPHCSTRMIARSSEQLTPIVRELRLACDNIECGHTCVAQLNLIRTVRPSSRPNPTIHLPLGDWRPANDTEPLPANDDKPPATQEPPTQAAPMSG
ncbi:ogr/Delta-like zinc finger family protein [Sphingomonas sp.]|uniref:ogr/Delta-like zinc finger family protein n=1 Tax=Sphingomonas sp. TaxID=28214 RepID=UPI002EDB4025